MTTESDHTEPDVWCIVVAAGSGRRYGAPKQFEILVDRPMVEHSVAVAAATCDGVVLVVPDGHADLGPPGVSAVVTGGHTRSESVRRGLDAVPADVGIVLVHDGARPLASRMLFDRVIEAVRGGAEIVVPVTTVVDTIRDVDDGVLDRDRLRAVQTPQGFSAPVLRSAHDSPLDATDDASLAESSGATATLVDGERTNLKVTEPADLAVADALLRSGALSQTGVG